MVIVAIYLLHVHYDIIIAMNDRILLSNKKYFSLIPKRETSSNACLMNGASSRNFIWYKFMETTTVFIEYILNMVKIGIVE